MSQDHLLGALADLTESVDRTDNVADACAEVVRFAIDRLGSDLAGVSQHEPGRPVRRLAASSPLVHELDEIAGALGQGPGAARLVDGDVITIGDTGTDPLWPTWGEAAVARRVRSVRLIGMPALQGGTTSLDLFSHGTNAFTTAGSLSAGRAAKHAGLALRHVDRLANLEEAMLTRALIGQAQGILMERFDLTSEQGMSFLRRSSQQLQIKVRDLAQQLVASQDQTPEHLGRKAPRVEYPG